MKHTNVNHTKLTRILIIVFVLAAVALPLSQARATQNEWQKIAPGGETICADGSPYHFFARTGANDNLVIFFQGGGACWDAATCSGGYYRSSLGGTDMLREGMYADRPENPFRNDNIVVVEYCSGDVHMGDAVQTYGEGKAQQTVHHKGNVNAKAALAWTYKTFPKPARVFISGSSAGSYGSIFHAADILTQYQGIPAAQLGDAGVGVIPEGWTGLQTWGTVDILRRTMPEFADIAPDAVTINQVYQFTAARFPAVTFTQFTTMADTVQAFFYALMGESRWTEHMLGQLDELVQNVPNFRAFVTGSNIHTIMQLPQFYTYQANGIPVRDWVEALANGEPVENVFCRNCAVYELVK